MTRAELLRDIEDTRARGRELKRLIEENPSEELYEAFGEEEIVHASLMEELSRFGG